MKNQIRYQLNRFSIRKQLFIIYIPIVFLSTFIIGVFFILDSTKLLTEKYENIVQSNAQLIKTTLLNTTNMAENTASYLSNDTQLRDILATTFKNENDARYQINNFNYLYRLKQQEPAIYNITIYSTNPTIPNYKFFHFSNDEIKLQEWYKKANNQPNSFWTTEKTDQLSNLVLYKNLPMPLSNYQAVLKIELDYNYLKNKIHNNNFYTELTLNHSPLFYSDQIRNLGTNPTLNPINNKNKGSYFITKDHTHYLVAKQELRLNNKQDYLTIYTADTVAYYSLKNNILKWSTILLIVLLMTFLIVVVFSNIFYSRIKKLQEAVYHASIEDYNFFNQISGQDEISKISLDFHTITQNIKKKEEQLYTSKLFEKELLNKQQQMEFHLLAGQINPHFLFNTLETIRMTALKNGNREVAQAIKLLAKSMHFTLDYQGKKIATLAEELNIVEGYIKIQQMRFGERVQFSLNLSSDIYPEKIDILPLILQPLVENAVTHGLEQIEKDGKIQLNIYTLDNYLIFSVKDNGIGIPYEKLQIIRQQILDSNNSNMKHIGLKNIAQRIKLFYGEDCHLSISSTQGVGTTVILKIHLIN